MDLTIIIVNWNSSRLLDQCLSSAEKWITGLSFEAVVVDNCSGEDNVRYIKENLLTKYNWARFIFNEKNLGYAGANNQGLKMAQGKYVLLLNPDTCFIEAGLKELLPALEQKDNGLISCKLLNGDETTQLSVFHFPTLSKIFMTSLLVYKILPAKIRRHFFYSIQDCNDRQKPDWVLGAFMLLRRDLMERIGGFDEGIFMYGEDLEMCYRIKRLNLDIIHNPDYQIIHYGGQSGSQAWSSARREVMVYRAVFYFYRKHKGLISLAAAKTLYTLGASLRLILHAITAILPARRQRSLNEIKTQWAVLLAQFSA